MRNRQIVSDVEECLKQGRTPLVLTKFKDHADTLLAMLQDKADHVFLLKGGRSRKENEQIRERMKSVPANESMILDKMYYKRLRAYKKIGYEIIMNTTEKKQETNAIFDSDSYMSVFERDLVEANAEIVISSPGVGARSIRRMLKGLGERHDEGVKITLLTLPADGYPKERIEKTKELLTELTEVGVAVMEKPGIHEHFAVIDREIVWYGSVNLLSNAKEEDNLMRVKSKEIAQELMESGFMDKAFG